MSIEEEFELRGDWHERASGQLVGLLAQCSKGRILMQLRDDYNHVVGAGHWGLFGGHVDKNETPQLAILREVEEELGLALKEDDLEPYWRYYIRSADKQVFLFRLLARLEPNLLCLGEGAGFAFLNTHQIQKFDLVNSVSDAVRVFASTQ